MAESSHSLVNSLWGEDQFADATIVMGQKQWRVHRAIICKQSKYFTRALEGHFEESKTKTIKLTGSGYLEEEVDGLLKYLYTRQLDARQQKDPIATFIIADYFQVTELRDKAAKEASSNLQKLINKGYFINFKKLCHVVLGQYPDTDLEAKVLKVIADNIRVVMYQSGTWEELITEHPSLANKVLQILYPKLEPATGVKRSAGVAFDDTLHAARTGPRPSGGHHLRKFGQNLLFGSYPADRSNSP